VMKTVKAASRAMATIATGESFKRIGERVYTARQLARLLAPRRRSCEKQITTGTV
jgi:hypothetical protein